MLKNKSIISASVIILIALIIFIGCGKTDTTKDSKTNKTETTENKTQPKGTAYKVNSAESIVNWKASKVTGKHNGTIKVAGGEVFIDNGKLSGGKIEVDMATLTDTDITDAESNKKLTGHLKSDDFFSVEKNPKSILEITSVTHKSGDDYEVKGNLIIKGISKPIIFPANVKVNGNTLSATANLEVDRTDYDIKFRSGKFFENLGDNLIHDKFNLEVKLNANS